MNLFILYLAIEPAINFAADGIILEIGNNKSALKYLNCVVWSDYPEENERLFIGGHYQLEIIGLHHIPSTKNYSLYVSGMNMFCRCIDGYPLRNGQKLNKKLSSIINKLVLNVYGEYKSSKPLDLYMCQIFNNILNKRNYIVIDINMLNHEYMYNIDELWNQKCLGQCYGYLKWHNIFLCENNKNIKFNKLKKLFKNITWIEIRSSLPAESQLNRSKCIESIEIFDELIISSLSLLIDNSCKCEEIIIFNPINCISSLNFLINKFYQSFAQKSCSIQLIHRKPLPIYICSYKCLFMKKI